MNWAHILSLPSGGTFSQHFDGRLAYCTDRCRSPDECPNGIAWVDVNRRARLALDEKTLWLPIICEKTGLSGWSPVPHDSAERVAHTCALTVEASGLGGWVEAAAARHLSTLGASWPGPRWRYGNANAVEEP